MARRGQTPPRTSGPRTEVGFYQNSEADWTGDVCCLAHGYVSRVLVDLENVSLVP